MERDTNTDWERIRQQLAEKTGRRYWRSLEEWAETAEFQQHLHREFPQGAAELANAVSRRRFLKLAAASLGLAGITACARQPLEKIVPYVEQPEKIVPGQPLFFATADLLGGFANGTLVESHDGHPTKVEGNPDHPASQGKSDVFAQASILSLYDPDRLQTVRSKGRIRTWQEFSAVLEIARNTQTADQGAGLRILTETVTSPTLAAQLQQIQEQFPQAQWRQYEPVNRDNVYAGTTMAFGEPLEPIYHFDRADVILSLASDFLFVGPGRLAYTRQFVNGRRVREDQTDMNRLYVVEPTPSLTGAMADHRWSLRPGQIEHFARAIANRLGLSVDTAANALPEMAPQVAPQVAALVDDLRAYQGRSLVIAGEGQPPVVHALAHAINDALGNLGKTVTFTAPVVAQPANRLDSLQTLVQDMNAGRVQLLLVLGGNPVYNSPADVDFAAALDNVPLSAYLGLYENETAVRCTWQLPQSHPLASWGDVRAYDGTTTIMQPLIRPLYGGRSAHEVLALLLGQSGRSGHDIVKSYWQEQSGAANFETWWQRTLHDGIVVESAAGETAVSLVPFTFPEPPQPSTDTQLVFRPDYSVWDGRFSNNGWLQELPRPFTKLTWGNAALVSPNTAEEMGLSNGDVVALTLNGRAVEAPVWVLPGQADGCVAVHWGYGRSRSGSVGSGTGFNAHRLRPAAATWFANGLALEATGRREQLASTQSHHAIEGREIVQSAPITTFRQDPDFLHAAAGEEELLSLYPEWEYEGYAWGMSINLNACIGCNACVVACQAENNIPVVGKEEVQIGREMHWIRVDTYFHGADLDNPEQVHQPVTCMHCENAPCEVVCPVAATVHSDEGLNDMIYNRCVGTRYCSNNCPYKVRRFNFLEYADWDTPSLKPLRNPDVTVRERGVMEKCTYCVQRINHARINAKKENRPIRDGEIVTACQQACPANAIVFGDINDNEAQVTHLKAQPHNYSLLAELGTRPRTTYLAKFTNPNPEIGD